MKFMKLLVAAFDMFCSLLPYILLFISGFYKLEFYQVFQVCMSIIFSPCLSLINRTGQNQYSLCYSSQYSCTVSSALACFWLL